MSAPHAYFFVADYEHLPAAKLLVEKGNVNVRDYNGVTVLRPAKAACYRKVVRLLRESDAVSVLVMFSYCVLLFTAHT